MAILRILRRSARSFAMISFSAALVAAGAPAGAAPSEETAASKGQVGSVSSAQRQGGNVNRPSGTGSTRPSGGGGSSRPAGTGGGARPRPTPLPAPAPGTPNRPATGTGGPNRPTPLPAPVPGPGRPNRPGPGWDGGPNRPTPLPAPVPGPGRPNRPTPLPAPVPGPGRPNRPGPGWGGGPNRPGHGPYRPRPGWNGNPWRPGHYPTRPFPRRGRDGYRSWYGYNNTTIIIGNTTILPAAWGWTGGGGWYGVAGYGGGVGTSVVFDAGQIIGILLEVNQSEIALAQSVLDRMDPCSTDFAQSVLDAHVNLASQLDPFFEHARVLR